MNAYQACAAGHRRHGYIPDVPGYRPILGQLQTNARGYLAARMAGSPLPTGRSLAQFRAPIMDQGPTSSCTGHGTAQGLYTSYNAAGTPLPWVPSPLDIYKLPRALARRPDAAGNIPALVDEGAMPSDVLDGVARYGVGPIQAPTSDGRYSDVEPANVNSEPELLELERDGQTIVTGLHRIDVSAADFIVQLQRAIALGVAVGIGAFVDVAFEDWVPSRGALTNVNLSDPSGGGHWMSCDCYQVLSSGIVVFELVSSWGTAPGEGGVFYVTDTWMRQSVSDAILFHTEANS